MSAMLIHVENVPMAIAESDRDRVIGNLRELKDDVWELKSENTKRAYQYDFNQYLGFCKDNALPAMASDVNVTKTTCRAYLDYLMSTKLKHHSIRRKIASVRYFIGVSELPDPWKQSKLFAEYTNHKINQKPSRQSQAAPMRLEIIDAINAKLDTDPLIGLRDAVIFNTAIDTIFRASNLLAIEIHHIDFAKQRIFAPRSKTDKSGKGQYGYISTTTINLIDKWLTRTGIADGPLLRKLSPKQTVQDNAMQYHALLARYKNLAATLNLEFKPSCHSTRVGGVVTMFERGISLDQIQKAGGWTSSAMPMHYGEEFDVTKTGMTNVR